MSTSDQGRAAGVGRGAGGPGGAGGAPGSGADGPGFDEAIEQVEDIIQRIERGDIGLEESLAEYERGVGLIRRCRGILQRVEQRVVELTEEMQAGAGGGGAGGAAAPGDGASRGRPAGEEATGR